MFGFIHRYRERLFWRGVEQMLREAKAERKRHNDLMVESIAHERGEYCIVFLCFAHMRPSYWVCRRSKRKHFQFEKLDEFVSFGAAWDALNIYAGAGE